MGLITRDDCQELNAQRCCSTCKDGERSEDVEVDDWEDDPSNDKTMKEGTLMNTAARSCPVLRTKQLSPRDLVARQWLTCEGSVFVDERASDSVTSKCNQQLIDQAQLGMRILRMTCQGNTYSA